ncbi:MAG: hypothetical protein WAS27_04495 [Candidatus Saccharimonadales bacterium]
MSQYGERGSFRRNPNEISVVSMHDYAWDIIRTGDPLSHEASFPHYDWDSYLGHFSLVTGTSQHTQPVYFLNAQDERLINSHIRYKIDLRENHVNQVNDAGEVSEVADPDRQDQLVMEYLRSNPIVPEHTLNHSGLLNFRELAARTAIFAAIDDKSNPLHLSTLAYYADNERASILRQHAVNKVLRQSIATDNYPEPLWRSESDIHVTLHRLINIERSKQRALPPPTPTQSPND